MKSLIKIIILSGIIIFQSCGTSLHISSGNLPVNETMTSSKSMKSKSKTKTTKPVVLAESKTNNVMKSGNKSATKVTKVTKVEKTEVKKEISPITQQTSNFSSTNQANMIISNAKTYLNTPYRMGGTSYSGIDCSALMMQSFKTQGINLPRTADAQANVGKSIPLSAVQPGDLLFFYSSQPGVVGHSGLVVSVENGTITFIHAALSGVRYDNMNSPHWQKHYLSAKRVIQ